MKVTKYIPLAFVLIMAFGCEDFYDFEGDMVDTYYEPLNNKKISDEVKNPIVVFSDFVIICDEYYYGNSSSVNYHYNRINNYGIQISSVNDFQSIIKECGLEDIKKYENSISNWKVDGLKPQTTYYCRFYSEDKLGGRKYKDTLAFKTNDIKFSDLVEIEVKEVGPTYANVQAKWNDAKVLNTGANATIESSFAIIHGNDTLKVTENKQYGENISDADFLSLTSDTSYELEIHISVKIDNLYNSNNSGSVMFSSKITTFTTPQYKVMDFVDLGTGIKWASCNLGATQPEQTGGYYSYPSPGNDVAGTYLDVVTKELGNGYRMPTRNELQQLCNSCSWTEDEMNGVKGMRCTGTNGNSIFFPYTGYIKDMKNYYAGPNYGNNYRYGSSPSEKGSGFYVLSGSGSSSVSNEFYHLTGPNAMGNPSITSYTDYSYSNSFAMPIRPVKP